MWYGMIKCMIYYDMICGMVLYDIWYINLLTAIGLTHSSCSTEHIYTQTIHRTTQIRTK